MNKIICGEALNELKKIDNNSIDCCISSPPYYALRDYEVPGQIGLEDTFEEYIKKLCDIYDEVKRVLKNEGTCFVNLGDTYSGSNCGSNDYRDKDGLGNAVNKKYNGQKAGKTSLPNKCLMMIPARFAIEMINRGWILRNQIIWHKPNALPSSVLDRFGVDYEIIYFFVKSKKYYFNIQYEPYADSSIIKYRQALRANKSYCSKELYKNNTSYVKRYKRGQGAITNRGNDSDGLVVGGKNEGRYKRCVWSIPTRSYSGAHFATFPPDLIKPCILAGCPKNGIVLDIFAGSGTTLDVARKLGHEYIGIELNPEYIKLIEKRLEQEILQWFD